MKMKHLLLIIIFLLPLNIYATSGKIKEESIIVCNNVKYGYHGSDNHWHAVNDEGNAQGPNLGTSFDCNSPSLNLSSISIEVTLNDCIDGDTASFKYENEVLKARFLAIDTPETNHPTKKEEYYGKEAKEYTCNSLKQAHKIVLEYDLNSDKTDKYNRQLVWVFIDSKLLQEDLVLQGYAKVAYLYGDYKYTDKLQKNEIIAKQNRIGIWNKEEKESNEKTDKIIEVLAIIASIIILIYNIKKKKN